MTRARELPSQEDLRSLFDYDENTGYLTWRKRDDVAPAFNGRFAGKRAGSIDGKRMQVMVNHRNVGYHRVIWKWVYGTDPAAEIDHINGNFYDNRLANLREADRNLNAKNRGPTKGRALPKGVRLQKDCKRYQAYLRLNGALVCLGYFATPEAAHTAYLKAAKDAWGDWARGNT